MSQTAALNRYHQHFDSEQYNSLAELFASSLYAEPG